MKRRYHEEISVRSSRPIHPGCCCRSSYRQSLKRHSSRTHCLDSSGHQSEGDRPRPLSRSRIESPAGRASDDPCDSRNRRNLADSGIAVVGDRSAPAYYSSQILDVQADQGQGWAHRVLWSLRNFSYPLRYRSAGRCAAARGPGPGLSSRIETDQRRPVPRQKRLRWPNFVDSPMFGLRRYVHKLRWQHHLCQALSAGQNLPHLQGMKSAHKRIGVTCHSLGVVDRTCSVASLRMGLHSPDCHTQTVGYV